MFYSHSNGIDTSTFNWKVFTFDCDDYNPNLDLYDPVTTRFGDSTVGTADDNNTWRMVNCFSQNWTVGTDDIVSECNTNWLVGFTSNESFVWKMTWSLHVRRPA